MSSLQHIMDMMRNASSDGVKRVYSNDSGMGSILDTESLISGGGPSSSSMGLFSSSRTVPIDMNKEERFSRKVFVGGLPPDIDEGKIYNSNYYFYFSKKFILPVLYSVNRGNYCTFSTIWSINS